MNNKLIIIELNKKQAEKLSRHIVDFNPIKCSACGNKKGIVQRFFLLNAPACSKLHEKIKRKLMEQFGLTYYAYCEDNMMVITTAKCPECDNEKMEWDY